MMLRKILKRLQQPSMWVKLAITRANFTYIALPYPSCDYASRHTKDIVCENSKTKLAQKVVVSITSSLLEESVQIMARGISKAPACSTSCIMLEKKLSRLLGHTRYTGQCVCTCTCSWYSYITHTSSGCWPRFNVHHHYLWEHFQPLNI